VQGRLEDVIGPPSELVSEIDNKTTRDRDCIDPLSASVHYLQSGNIVLPENSETLVIGMGPDTFHTLGSRRGLRRIMKQPHDYPRSGELVVKEILWEI
jgi:hypothetical protein